MIGALQVLCEVAKSGPADLVQGNAARFFAIADAIEASAVLNSNTIVRKFKTKLVARIPLRILPPTSNATRRKGRSPFSAVDSIVSNVSDRPRADGPRLKCA